jgi:Pectinacetylesterase
MTGKRMEVGRMVMVCWVVIMILMGTVRGVLVKYYVDNVDAKCLDGTTPILYYKAGYGSGANKLIIYQNGGGWCGSSDSNLTLTLLDCYQRSLTSLGSSTPYTEYLQFPPG